MAAVPLEFQLLQYIPQRFYLRISTSALLQSLQSFFSSLVLLFLLPFLSTRLLTRSHEPLSPNRRDVLLARISLSVQGLGWLIIGFAPHIIVLVLGLGVNAFTAGAGAAMRAAVTPWVSPDEVGRLYSILGIAECLGLLGAGPAVAGLYNLGLRMHEEVYLGLPWIVSGLTMLGIVIVLWTLRL